MPVFRAAECYIPLSGTAARVVLSGALPTCQWPNRRAMRALERGLRVLEALEANQISSLHALHVATGISKPSLLRVLNTLEEFRLVSRRLGDGRYRASTSLTRRPRRHARYDRVAEAAAPVLDRLCQR